jgi:hypothetical protein
LRKDKGDKGHKGDSREKENTFAHTGMLPESTTKNDYSSPYYLLPTTYFQIGLNPEP